MARQLLHRYPIHSFRRLAPILHGLRAVKSPIEVDIIRDAVAITKNGLDKVLSHLKPGVKEYELEADLIGEFTRRRAIMGYEPIVASGKNACTLHYIDNTSTCEAGDLLLIDVGANHANYTADVTRVFPVSGRFTPRQKELYLAVLSRITEFDSANCNRYNSFTVEVGCSAPNGRRASCPWPHQSGGVRV